MPSAITGRTGTGTIAAVIRRLAVPAVIAVALAACGGGADEPDAATAPTTTAAAIERPATSEGSSESTGTPESTGIDAGGAIVPEALQFSAPLVGGGDIEMASLAGRPVLLWFWAPW